MFDSNQNRGGARPGLSLLVVTVAIALLVAVAFIAAQSWGRPQGPLACPDCAREGVRFSVHVSKPFTWDMVTLGNGGNRPVVLDSVTLIDATPGLEVTGIFGVSKGAGRHSHE